MKINKLRMLASDKGFTLIELMIVIAIIGILAAVAIPNFIAYRDKSFCSAAEADANSIAARFSDYFAIPTHTSMFVAAAGAPGSIANNGAGTGLLGSDFTVAGSFGKLSGTNTATVSGSINNIIITVRDGSGRCPLDYQGSNAEWSKTKPGRYTKNMQ